MVETIAARQVSICLPPCRMLVLVVWIEIAADGTTKDRLEYFDVLGIETIVGRNGRLYRYPQIVLDGEILNLAEAMWINWDGLRVADIIFCPWARDLDQKQLAEPIEALHAKARKEHRERLQVQMN